MSRSRTRAPWWIAILLSVALIGAFGAAFPGRSAAQQTQAAGTIRFVHALAGGGPVDVLLDGNPIVKGIAFGTSTEYVSLPPGDHGIKVVQAGQDQSTPYVDQTVTVKSGAAYIFVIGGQTTKIDAQVFSVNLDAVDVGQARYRIIQASSELGDVSVQLGDNANATSGGNVSGAAANAASGNTTGSLGGSIGYLVDAGYQQAAAGSYTMHVNTASTNQAAFAAPTIMLDSGQVYDLIVVGQSADQSLTILPLVTTVFASCSTLLGVGTQKDACVRFVHVSPDAGAVDVMVDGVAVASKISYGSVTMFTAVANADHQIQVVPTGQPASAAVLDKTMTFSTGQAYQVAVVGLATKDNEDNNNLALHMDAIDLTPLPAGQARVRIIHAVPDAGETTVSTADGTALLDKVTFNNASSYALVNAISYDLKIQVALSGDQGPIVVNAPGTAFTEGMVYDLFLIGRTTDVSSVQLLVVTSQSTVRTGAQGAPIIIGSPAAPAAASPVGSASVTVIANVSAGTPVGTAAASPIAMTATPMPAMTPTPPTTPTPAPTTTPTSTPPTTVAVTVTVTVTPSS